jgi:O-antigen/teichoic acid export membrane protein
MLKTWRTQDEKPLYGVNQDLLRLVLQHEQADLRRRLRWEQWSIYAGSALVLGFLLFFLLLAFVLHYNGLGTVVGGIGVAVILAGAGSLWLSRRRQAQRERGFGNSLREEIKRNLSLVDYQLSRHGRFGSSLLAMVPTTLGGVAVCWLSLQINTHPNEWAKANGWWLKTGTFLFVLASGVLSAIWSSHKAKQRLLPRKRRLSELLELLNKNE